MTFHHIFQKQNLQLYQVVLFQRLFYLLNEIFYLITLDQHHNSLLSLMLMVYPHTNESNEVRAYYLTTTEALLLHEHLIFVKKRKKKLDDI